MDDLIHRLRERARIRRQIPSRKSVQENKSDRIADLLDEAATEIETLQDKIDHLYAESDSKSEFEKEVEWGDDW